MRKLSVIVLVFYVVMLAACSSEPVEVTRVIETETEVEVEVEVTRLVETEVTRVVETEVTREVEVTRLVEVILDPTPTSTPLPTAIPEFGGKDNPYPIGVPGTVETEEGLSFQMTILDVIRGDDAYQIAVKANSYNEPPPEGYELVFAHMQVEYTGDDRGILEIDDNRIQSLTNNRVVNKRDGAYDYPCCYDFKFDEIVLFQGGFAEGWNFFLASEDDPNPIAILDFENRLITSPAYFSLANGEALEGEGSGTDANELGQVENNDEALLEAAASYMMGLATFGNKLVDVLENVDNIDDAKYESLIGSVLELAVLRAEMEEIEPDFSEPVAQFYDLQMATNEACSHWGSGAILAIGGLKDDPDSAETKAAYDVMMAAFDRCVLAANTSKPVLEDLAFE